MNESRWETIEFGREHYDALVFGGGARVLSEVDDNQLIGFVKSLHRSRTSFIDWGSGRLRNCISIDTSESFIKCDEHLVKLFNDLKIPGDDRAWIAWHDQAESVEIEVQSALNHAVELIFVGQGMIALDKSKRWIVEYAPNRWLHGAWLTAYSES